MARLGRFLAAHEIECFPYLRRQGARNQQQPVTGLNAVGLWPFDRLVTPEQPKNTRPRLTQLTGNIFTYQGFTGVERQFQYAPGRLRRHFITLAVRQQAPAEQDQIGQPHRANGQPHRRHGEEAERRPQCLLTEGGQDHIRRRGDQGRHAADHGGEAERHQYHPHLFLALPRQFRRQRHHDHQGGDMVHESRQKTGAQQKHGQACRKPGLFRDNRACDPARHAGQFQCPPHHQHGGHGNHRRIGKPFQGIIELHQAGRETGKQGR